MTSHRVVFTPSGHTGVVDDGTSVLDAARQLGVDLDSVCGGRGICGHCQVTPSVGSFAKWAITAEAGALGPLGEFETNYRANRSLEPGNRLGCAARICGDAVVDVPAASQVHRQVVRKALNVSALVVDPSFSLYYIEVPKAVLGEAVSASGLVADAVAEQHGRTRPLIDHLVLAKLQPALDNDDGAATVAVQHTVHGDVVKAIWPGYVDAAYGIAVDVGSTTIAGHLCNLFTGEALASAGRMNPQIRFGEDLMSRVSYVMMNPGGDKQLTDVVRSALDELVGELVEEAGTARERVLEIVIVANPIMHHLVLGIDPTPLGSAPFVLATDESVSGPAKDLDLDLVNASFYVGPCIAGHVGADTAAVMLAEGPHRGTDWQLVVDVGTNAEIVLGNRKRQFAASSPTGPAFEGAQISCGQRATAGAIEKVRIDPLTLECRLKVIGSDLWSDEPGFAEAIEMTGVTGICGSGIIDVIGEMYLAGVMDQDGVIKGDNAGRSSRIVSDGRTFSYLMYEPVDGAGGDHPLMVTQNDVRAIQLAKAALRAGIDLLVEHAGSPQLGDIRLAGAFGAHIDPLHAMVLGLVPDCELKGVRSVGNAAGAGAVMALLSRTSRAEMETAVRRVEKIETATEPRFQELFVNAMAMPHATVPTPHLAELVALPERSASAGGRQRGRARRDAAAKAGPGGDETNESSAPSGPTAPPAANSPNDMNEGASV